MKLKTILFNRATPIALVLPGLLLLEATSAEAAELSKPDLTHPESRREQVAQDETPVQIIEVRLNLHDRAGDRELEIILDTLDNASLLIDASRFRAEGDRLIAEIANASLALAEGEEFNVEAPAPDIAQVQVRQRDAQTVEVIVVGRDALPTTDVVLRSGIFAYVLNPTDVGTEEELVVVGVDESGDAYAWPDTITGTRTPTPILEIPQSVQVIPRQVLEDQQANDLGEALSNIGGASVNATEGRGFQINLRGFDGVPLFRDGFRLYSPNDNGDAAGQGFPEIANIERIEVLRGPSSVLFGQIDPGGLINIVSKKPLDEPFYEVGLQAGSYGLVRPQIDISGPLTADDRLLYRLTAVYQHEDSFRDFDEKTDRFFVGPSLTWKISDRTNFNFQFEYLHDDRPLDPGLVALGRDVADIPYDRILGEPDDQISSEFVNIGYNLEHEFNDNWTLRNGFRYLRNESDISATLSFPFPPLRGLNERTGVLNRVFAEQEVTNQTLALQTNAVGKFATGPLDHTLLLGIDLARYTLQNDSFTNFSLLTPINIFNPVYGAVARPNRGPRVTATSTDTNSLQVYVQDQVDLLDNLSLVAGFNYEVVDQTTTTRAATTTESGQNRDAFSPRVGLVYQPLENVSLYANYSRSFLPSSALDRNFNLLEPEQGQGFEVGVKTELFDRRLLATLAYFNLTKQNVATPDPSPPPRPLNTAASVATGEQQSQGVEFDVIGEVLPGWNLIASYAYIDAEVTKDNRVPSVVGNRLPGVAQHSASVWNTYEIQAGGLKGLGFGLGMNWVGDRQGDLTNSFDLDSYFLTNAAIFYRREDWRLALNFKNLFNVDFITGTPRTRTRGIEAGEPFTVIGSFSYRF
jgi:iron complex outermembrane receptor protein